MRHIKYIQFDSTPPEGGFFVSLFNPPFWGFFLSSIYLFINGGENYNGIFI
jgi:threonine/homoserine/homoserine lactone efflux protein